MKEFNKEKIQTDGLESICKKLEEEIAQKNIQIQALKDSS